MTGSSVDRFTMLRPTPVQLFVALCFFNIVAVTAAVLLMPSVIYLVLAEDGIVEWISALLFLVAFLYCCFALFYWNNKQDSLFIGMLAMISMAAFLSEFSFGERMFNLSMPTLAGVKIDAVHDLISVAINIFWWMEHHVGATVWLALSAGVALLAALLWPYRNRIIGCISDFFPPCGQVRWLFGMFLVIVIVALAIDVSRMRSIFLVIAEETLELNAGLAMLFCCVVAVRRRRAI